MEENSSPLPFADIPRATAIFQALEDLKHETLQIIRFRRSEKHGVVFGLAAHFHQAQLPPYIPGSIQQYFQEEILGHMVRTGASNQKTT